MSLIDNVSKLDQLIKSLEELEKKGKSKDDLEGHGHARDGEPMDAANKAEVLSKPPVSEAQRRAMFAAASGKGNIGIPKSVGKDFAEADKGGKLPEKKKVKKSFDDMLDEVFTKSEKDELFPKIELLVAKDCPAPVMSRSKSDLARDIYYKVKDLSDIRSQSWNVQDKTPEAKKAMELHFENEKKALQKLIKEFQNAKDVAKSESEGDLEKADKLYHIHQDGYRITDEPKPMSEIIAQHGPVKKLEAAGFRLHPVEPSKEVKKSVDLYTLNKAADVIKPKKPSPASAYVGEYKKPNMSPNTQDEATAHTLSYDKKGNVTAKPPAVKPAEKPAAAKPEVAKPKAVETHSRMQQAKIKGGKSSFSAPTALESIKERQKKLNKSEVFSSITTESLTKSIRELHSDEQITEMLKAAYDLGKIHHNVFLEWQNYRTVNPVIVNFMYDDE